MIKPSGVSFEDLGPENMVVVDVNANVIEGQHKPSSDTATHCYVYRAMPEVGASIHTHSPYAHGLGGWAATSVHLTAMADEFGGPIRAAASR